MVRHGVDANRPVHPSRGRRLSRSPQDRLHGRDVGASGCAKASATRPAARFRRAAEQQRIKELEREVRELRKTNEILKLASAYFAQAELDRRQEVNAFIDEHRASLRGRADLQCLQVAPSAYWRHAARQRTRRCCRAAPSAMPSLMPHIQRVWNGQPAGHTAPTRSGSSLNREARPWRAAPSNG